MFTFLVWVLLVSASTRAISSGGNGPHMTVQACNDIREPGHLGLYRPGTGNIWILRHENVFTPEYSTGLQPGGGGIGGYNLGDVNDRIFTFDYKGKGVQDHLVLYRPGTGKISIVQNKCGVYSSVYAVEVGGIGGFDLANQADQGIAFDYESTGRQDHLLFYRPGAGKISIISHGPGATFSPVFVANSGGIGGYDLSNQYDRIFAFDYDHSGNADHLVLYRPGFKKISILKRLVGTTFLPVYETDTAGIGGWDLWGNPGQDQALAFDFTSSCKLDYLVFYRPSTGTGPFWILQNTGGTFTPVYKQVDPGLGIGGYKLFNSRDRVIAYDYDGIGKLDHFVANRPGRGIIWILKNVQSSFVPIYIQGDPSVSTNGVGIGGFDLQNSADRVFTYDYFYDEGECSSSSTVQHEEQNHGEHGRPDPKHSYSAHHPYLLKRPSSGKSDGRNSSNYSQSFSNLYRFNVE